VAAGLAAGSGSCGQALGGAGPNRQVTTAPRGPGDLLAGGSGHRLGLVAATSSAVAIQVVGDPTPQGVLIHYVTAPANKPNTFHDQLYAWETTANEVPWDKPPVGAAQPSSDSPTATEPLSFSYEDKGYIFGYAVADRTSAVCATVYIPAGKTGDPTQWEYASVDLKTVYADSNVVQVRYTVLPAYRPFTNKNWVGVWQGSSVPYDGAPPLGSAPVPSDAETGYAVISGLALNANNTYSVGYFLVDSASGRTALGAQAVFTIATK
jgi:hypothetical protein